MKFDRCKYQIGILTEEIALKLLRLTTYIF